MSKKMSVLRLVALVLAVIMMCSAFAACGGGSESSAPASSAASESKAESKEESKEESKAEEPEPAGNKVPITIYRCCYNIPSPNQDQVKKVENAINEYIADKGNVEIHINEISSAEYKEKANLAIANGEVNLLWNASWWETIGTNDLYANQAAYDVTDLLPGTKLWDSMPEAIWDASKYDGRVLFIPVYKESCEGYVLSCREAAVQEAGVDVSTIDSWDKAEGMLEAFKNAGIEYPYYDGGPFFFRSNLPSFDFFLQNSMIGVSRDKNEVVNTVLTPEYADWCKRMAKWVANGWKSLDDVTNTLPDQLGKSDRYGCTWWTEIPNNEEASERNGQQMVFTPSLTGNWAHSTTTLGSCFTVISSCTEEEAKACIEWLSILYTDETVANLYTFGIKDEDYTVNEDGRFHKLSAEEGGGKYNHSAWESANVMSVGLEENEPMNKKDLYADFNARAIGSCASGFRVNKDNFAAEMAACQGVYGEYARALECGGYAVDEIDGKIAEYMDALNGAGYQTIFDECYAQYEAWKANS